MNALAGKYGCTLEQATAVFVSTSPNNDYINNLRSTVSILDGWRRGLAETDVVISTYNHCRAGAWAYLNGACFLTKTRGPKIKAFYQNILDPQDRQPVTVDGHVVGAWAGRRMLMKDVATHKFHYETVAQDVRDLAQEHSLVPCQVQGIIWFTWKRVHNVVYSGNLNLFGDHWGLDLDPTELRPFKRKT